MVCSHAVGAQARLMSHALRKITANASKCHTTIIFLNQLRMKVTHRSVPVMPAGYSGSTSMWRAARRCCATTGLSDVQSAHIRMGADSS